MVQAILDGRKTMTRRIVKDRAGRQPSLDFACSSHCDGWNQCRILSGNGTSPAIKKLECRYHISCPCGQVGSHLWVRETWYASEVDKKYLIGYKADGDIPHGQGYYVRPSIFMPRSLSRITLEITDIRVERLRDITEEDAKKEGKDSTWLTTQGAVTWKVQNTNARYEFMKLWDSINAKRGYSWESNPWVWVIEFKREVGQ